MTDADERTRRKVREGYAGIAKSGGRSCCGGSTCAEPPTLVNRHAENLGYDAADLASLPEGANMGLSCGNPVALAALRPGETVVDLGSGGGFDVFIAGRKVGPAGRAIGVDMTAEMVAKARGNIESYRRAGGAENVEFRLGEIEHLPLADASADVVISNCVINLCPDKPQVWREIARVLKPGGRVAVSDLALKRPLPPAVAGMIEALVGCIAGAALVEETGSWARESGLDRIRLEERDGAIESIASVNDPLYRRILEALPDGGKPGHYVTSLLIEARKPEWR
jgi:SAM-dependent methyltransferase